MSQEFSSESSSETGLTWVDSHAHLDFDRFDQDRSEVIERALNRGVRRIISIGTRVASTQSAIELARQYPGLIYASAGFHPLYMADDHPEGWSAIERFMRAPEVIAIGETGLDYYYDTTPHQQQRDSLRRHLQLSRRFDKPLIIHIRDAFEDAWRIIAEEGTPAGGVVHCFTGGPEECKRAIELGLYVSLSGIATFKSARELRRAVTLIPSDRLLIETDSPFLAPHPHRGKRNEPSFVVDTARCVSELRGVTLAELATTTWENTSRLFRLPNIYEGAAQQTSIQGAS